MTFACLASSHQLFEVIWRDLFRLVRMNSGSGVDPIVLLREWNHGI